MDQSQVVYFFLSSMVGTPPGAHLGRLITNRTNPNTSYKSSCVILFVVLITGVFTLEGKSQTMAYVWGFFVGMVLGWFYSVENLFFAMAMPPGSETELAGFFVYCTQILVWLPPLLFTIIIEQGVHQKYGWLATLGFLPVAAGILMFAAPWDEIVAEAKISTKSFLADQGAAVPPDDDEEEASPAQKKELAGGGDEEASA